MVRGRSQKCEQMRASISAEIDGELSEFESILLRGHLNRCGSCRAFKTDAQRFATAMRGAPLEPLSRAVAVPSRRRKLVSLRVPVAAAVAVSMIVFGGVFESLHSGAVIHASQPSGAAFNSQDLRFLQLQKTQRTNNQLAVRRAQTQASQIPRHPGFQP
jgi:predicted anti-sigma-YlaC factor YlaD